LLFTCLPVFPVTRNTNTKYEFMMLKLWLPFG